MPFEEADGGDQIGRGIVMGPVDVETAPDDGFAGDLELGFGVDHADPRIVTTGTEESDAIRDQAGTAGDLDDDVGGVCGDLVLGSGEGWDASHGRDEEQTFRIAIDHDDLAPSGGVEQGTSIEAEEAGALDDHGVLRGGQVPEDGDHGGERTIGRGGHAIRDGIGKGDDGGAGAENDVGGITAVETGTVSERGVTVLEEVIAFLGKVPPRAWSAFPATVGQGPGDAGSHEGGVATVADSKDPAHCLVSEDTGGWAVSTSGMGVEIGSAEGGQGDLDEAFTGAWEIEGWEILKEEGRTGTLEDGGAWMDHGR